MPNNRKRLVGRVVSNKMDKTVVVAIERFMTHRLYKKVIRSTKKVLAHDENNSVPVGAIVRIVESRPLSKRKRWAVEEIIDTVADAEARQQAAEDERDFSQEADIT
jgi:small subunit ribosomal protein S17